MSAFIYIRFAHSVHFLLCLPYATCSTYACVLYLHTRLVRILLAWLDSQSHEPVNFIIHQGRIKTVHDLFDLIINSLTLLQLTLLSSANV